MLLTISTTHVPAADLSYLLHKHPAKVQSVDISTGKAHIFYTVASEYQCTVCLLLDIDPIGLVRKTGSAGNDFALEQYVNDRPYVASSFMSAAIAKAFASAMNGRCKDKPGLVTVAIPFVVTIAVLPIRGGEQLLRQLFEPLGYSIALVQHVADPAFPTWGNSRYYTVTLRNTITLQQLLSHLYILIPVCDNDKHYWVGEHEIEKLLEKGQHWLPGHPARELITMRYLRHQQKLYNQALDILLKDEPDEEEDVQPEEKAPVRIHDLRLQMVRDELLKLSVRRVADLGCGEGKLLKLLLAEKQFAFILGMDVSYRALAIAKDKLRVEKLPVYQQKRLQLIQGSLSYRDTRIEGYDAAVLVEVIEHMDEPRLAAMEKVLFEYARPEHIVITTPNAEYNVKFEKMDEGQLRHKDHRFEWTRKQFEEWGNRIGKEYGYTTVYKPIGEDDPEVGPLTQMAVFTNK
ncbi:MAG: 3' terminal RNA ribose 2'-O-methyltransferase Hen1 [Chitinophagaceae bacterium]